MYKRQVFAVLVRGLLVGESVVDAEDLDELVDRRPVPLFAERLAEFQRGDVGGFGAGFQHGGVGRSVVEARRAQDVGAVVGPGALNPFQTQYFGGFAVLRGCLLYTSRCV